MVRHGLLKIPFTFCLGVCVKNIARIANAVPFTLYSRVTMNDGIVVLNCQKCKTQCQNEVRNLSGKTKNLKSLETPKERYRQVTILDLDYI